MKWFNSWMQGIIISVIVTTIIEMLLPENNNKKYIKLIMGIYILFSIMAPVISSIIGKQIKINDFVKEEYSSVQYNNVTLDTNSYIIKDYKNNIEKKIKEDIETLGYVVNDLKMDFNKNNNENIKSITVEIIKSKKEDEKNNNVIKINDIDITRQKNLINEISLNEDEKKKVHEMLYDKYEIEDINIKS